MQLKLATDYAVRCVLYLAIYPGSATAETIGKAMGISHNYTQRILQDLKKAGLVSSIQGSSGGYVLARDPQQIRMIDLIKPEEQSTRINRCLEPDGFCSRNGIEKNCPVHSYYVILQDMIDRYLENTTIFDLLHPQDKKEEESKKPS